MMRISRPWVGGIVLLAALALAAPALAQTGGIRGKVTDQAGNPVPDAVVKIEAKSMTRKLEVKTNKKGEYIQIGLYPGEYKITASKDNLSWTIEKNIGLGDPEMLDIKLAPAAPSKEAADQNAKVRQIFDDGVTAAKAEKWDDAIAKVTEAAGLVPNCHVCYFNIGRQRKSVCGRRWRRRRWRARRGRRWRQCARAVQPGCHSLESDQVHRGQGQV